MSKRTQRQQAVIEAAIEWWESRRPSEWTEDEHVEHPTVSIGYAAGERLAAVVAKEVRARKVNEYRKASS